MKILKGSDIVMNHKVNDDYTCVLVQFEETDLHFFPEKKNWLPKHQEIGDLIRTLIEVEPEQNIQHFIDFLLINVDRGIKDRK